MGDQVTNQTVVDRGLREFKDALDIAKKKDKSAVLFHNAELGVYVRCESKRRAGQVAALLEERGWPVEYNSRITDRLVLILGVPEKQRLSVGGRKLLERKIPTGRGRR